jgi:quercetin dioxygenase-like cupin family protein
MTRRNLVACSVVALVFFAAALVAALAQAPAPFRRTLIQQADLSAPGREVVQAVAEVDAGAQSGRHTHPGEEIGYILSGPVVLEIDGQPARTLQTGEGFLIPAGAVHNARNSGKTVAKVLATYVIEKGKPVATPAP